MMLIVSTALLFSCGQQQAENTQSTGELENALDPKGGQAAVADESSQKNILHVALGSKDHTTLVAAVQAAAYENALVNAGPFTVFAPTDQAFGALPAGTVDELVKPENQLKLQDILEYHVYIGNLSAESLTEGRVLGMANGGKVTCANDNGTVTVNGAKIVASVPCSNGIVHVVDKVLLPQ
jgi:uncharacterized surface protein with fasciclin (FAS1) repeats